VEEFHVWLKQADYGHVNWGVLDVRTVSHGIVAAAGIGKRMAPLSYGVPKEMLPLILHDGAVLKIRPILHVILESLYHTGVSHVSIVISRRKTAIVDYLTREWVRPRQYSFTPSASGPHSTDIHNTLFRNLSLVYQDEPRGFGDAVLRAVATSVGEPLIVHAGDEVLLGSHMIRRLVDAFYAHNADVALFTRRSCRPTSYGVVEMKPLDGHVFQVTRIEEKPERAFACDVAVAIYVVGPMFIDALRQCAKGPPPIEITTAIQSVVTDGGRVIALPLGQEVLLGTGDPLTYIESLAYAIGNYRGQSIRCELQ